MKLYRSHEDRRLTGVCGGLAKNLGWDSGRVRVIWVLTTLFTGGGGILVYLALWYLMPEEALPAPAFDPPPLQPWKRSL
jgi:phage shock protein PspC (stress-responsive transcriptional regulator)